MIWEYYNDPAYFDMWAVRKIGDRNFNSKNLFHVTSKEEAIRLTEELNKMTYDLENNFVYHAPKEGQQEKYEAIRSKAKELAQLILVACPDSRERSVALTELETAMFWANASIARNE